MPNEEKTNGIGTLNEHSLHAFLKEHYGPDPACREIRIGRYIADIVAAPDNIVEIQTRGFFSLQKKLTFFLKEHDVTVVYPVAQLKRLIWVDPETGEASNPRRSPKAAGAWEIFYELIHIKGLLCDERLHLKVVLLELDEYRRLDGWSRDRKKGSTRLDRVPRGILREIDVASPAMYARLLPETLPEAFTSADFMTCAKASRTLAQRAITVLREVGAVRCVGKKGNARIYSLTK